jgi:CorA-like Mg2+ transporter protein
MFGYLKNQLEQLSRKNKARDHDETLRRLLDELLDITDEVKMLNEIKDVHDELEMILGVFDAQLEVLSQMNSLLTYRKRPLAPHILKNWSKIMDRIEQRREKVQAMDANAHRTYKSINNLFDMKQRQANVLEAHYSRKVAQDSGRQATTIMVFTTVSVIFLPLSFMSSFYALSIREFPRDPKNQNQVFMPLSYVAFRVFGIGFAIAAVLVMLAFGINGIISRYPALFSPTAQGQAGSSRASGRSSSISSLNARYAARSTPMAAATNNVVVERKRVEAQRVDGSSIFSFDSYSPSPGKKESISSKSVALASRFWIRSSTAAMDLDGVDGAGGEDGVEYEEREKEKGYVRSWDVTANERLKRKRWLWRGGREGRVFTAPPDV